MQLSVDQQNAVDKFMDFLLDSVNNEMVIEGHSGSGKSSLVPYLLKAARSQADLLKLLTNSDKELNVYLTATTNKAAKVLEQKTKEETTTIHSLLGIRPIPDFKSGKMKLTKTNNYQVVHNTLVIIDEASMIDRTLLSMIRDSTKKCKVLYIGDPYQLPPVFEDISGVFVSVPVKAELRTIMRQGKGNPIIQLGEDFRSTVDTGAFKPIIPDGKIIQHLDGPSFQQVLESTYLNANCYEDCKTIAWSNSTVNGYNNHIRKLFTKENMFQPGEDVVAGSPIIKNQKIIANTDEIVTINGAPCADVCHDVPGYWTKINGSEIFVADDQKVVDWHLKQAKKAGNWHHFYALKDFFADLRPIYASTVHKAQGSTYKNVFINLGDIGKNNKAKEVAKLLYVGITRASDNVYLYGDLPDKYKG